MNLIPSVQFDDVYQIEQLDYITADLANIQPQQLLNRLSYVYYYKDIDIDNERNTDDITIEGLWDDDDTIEQSIEEIESQSDVVDIVGTYSELQQYDTSDLNVNDVIKVIADENYDNLSTYYKWNGSIFTYQSYERKITPIVITQNTTVAPIHDVIYIVNGSTPTVEISISSSLLIGTSITFVAVQRFTLTWTSIDTTQHSLNVLSGKSLQLYFDGNSFVQWKDDILDSIYPIGSVVLRTENTQPPVGGVWQLLPEGYVLCPDTVDIGTENVVANPTVTPVVTSGVTGSTAITVAMLPAHTHTISGGLNSGGNHTHSYSGPNSAINGTIRSASNGLKTKKTGTTSSAGPAHYHYISAALGNSSQYPNATAVAHNHTFTGTAETINIMQASYALYAWKRVS